MQNVSKTLYIPLYGKAFVSSRGIILSDPTAERIWQQEGFALKGKARSKWLAYSMSMRASVFDGWLREQLAKTPDAVVLHIGCGMDSRVCRLAEARIGCQWYDIDFPDVIAERKRYYTEDEQYRMLEGDATRPEWLGQIPAGGNAIVVMEGLSMYLPYPALTGLLCALRSHFGSTVALMDCYTTFGAKASKYKNPINTVGVTKTYGIDEPAQLAADAGYAYLGEHCMAPETLIAQLKGWEQGIFRKLFAGAFASKIYRMYSFEG